MSSLKTLDQNHVVDTLIVAIWYNILKSESIFNYTCFVNVLLKKYIKGY